MVTVSTGSSEFDGFAVAVTKVVGVIVVAGRVEGATTVVDVPPSRGLVSLELTHGAITHWDIKLLSTSWPFCFEGVRLSTYEVSKLPAPQATRPTKTSEFWLIRVF